MLRSVSRIFLQKSGLLQIARPMCKAQPPMEYFDDSILPKYSKEGIPMRDPRDVNDPDYDRPVGNVASENFTFDKELGIGQTAEEETQHFEEYVSKFGEARFAEFAPKIQSRDFIVSSDSEEWKFVERLFPQTLIPQIENKEKFASGFKLPRISPEEAMEKYQYFVGRPVTQMLPVYLKTDIYGPNEREKERLMTRLRQCEGNLFQLRKDIDAFLYAKYKQEFVAQVSELQQMIVYIGDFEEELKEFLLMKGF